MKERKLSVINEIIVHCSATPRGREVSAKEIDYWHRKRGFDCIGYHYIVHLDGSVEEGRPLNCEGAHCTGHNRRSIGICYIGGLDGEGRPADTRTPDQHIALLLLLQRLCFVFGISPADIHGHREYANKACPCYNVQVDVLGMQDTTLLHLTLRHYRYGTWKPGASDPFDANLERVKQGCDRREETVEK